MARTPLFHSLLRTFRLLRRARAEGIPADELLARERARKQERGYTRRHFLQMSAASVIAVPVLNACGGDDNGNGGDDPRVVIVGAGIAGLHAAYRLKQAGVRSTVYDAATRVGGRMYTDRATFAAPDGHHCELGGELIDTGHMTMRDLATELEIPLLDYDEDDDALASVVAYFGGQKLTEAQILEGFAPIAEQIDAALASLDDQDDLFVYYDNHNGGEALDALSLTAWLDQIGASGPFRQLLEVAYVIEYGLDAGETNVLNMMFLISTDTETFEVFGDSDERFHAATGSDSFTTKLADELDDGQLELGARLTAVKASGTTTTLTFQRDGSTFDVVADHVVLALPFTMLRQVDLTASGFSEQKLLAINELGYGANAKLMVGFNTRPWRSEHGSNGETFTDLPYQSTWETSRLQGGTSGIITNYTGGTPAIAAGNGTPAERATEFLDGFDTVFPGAKAAANGKVARFHWPTSPLVLASYSAYKVGQYTTITGSEAERQGNVHFAGEHTNLDAQGYMEGGALSGAIAADEILEDLNISPATILLPAAARSTFARARTARTFRRWKAGLRRRLPAAAAR